MLASQQDLDQSLERLMHLDGRLVPFYTACGPIALRQRETGLSGLLAIVLAQQVSVASAKAIWERFSCAFGICDAQQIVASSDDYLRSLSLSRPKVRSVKAIAQAVLEGFDLSALAAMEGEEAHSRLCQLHGVGPWTADIYLLFCLGHGDVFPAGDLALQVSVAEAFALTERPDAKALALMAQKDWAPERSAAAHLFWAYYRVLKTGRDGIV